MANRNAISIELIAKTEKAAKGIQDINSKLTDFGKRASDLSNKLRNLVTLGGSIGILTAAVGGLVSKGRELADIFAVQEQAEAKLASTLKATGQYTPQYTREMKNLASAMQSITIYGDETVIGLESIYIATRKISHDVMPRATMAALDMAAALGEDATGAARRLAKVLADPTTGLDSLKEANIALTKAQMAEIAELAKQGDLIGAQERILTAVESAYAGTAKAIADTDTGKLQQIANVWGDIKEGLGSALLDSIGPALDTVLGILQAISGEMSSLSEQNAIKLALETDGAAADLGAFTTEALQQALVTNTNLALHKSTAYDNPAARIGAPASSAIGSGMIPIAAETSAEAAYAEAIKWELYNRQAAAKWGGTASAVESGPEPVSPAAGASFLDKYGSLSASYKAAGYDAAIAQGEAELKTLKKTDAAYIQITESIAALNKQKTALFATPEDDPLGDFIEKNASLSKTSRESGILADLDEAQQLYADLADKSSEQAVILDEIISAKKEELRITRGIKTEEEEKEEALKAQEEALQKMQESADELNAEIHLWTRASADVVSAGFDLADTLMQNDLDKLEQKLSEAEKLYDEYFSEIDSKYEKEKNALDAYYAAGEISEEEYYAKKQEMAEAQEEEAERLRKQKKDAEEKVEAQRKTMFRVNKANAVATAAINGALAISDIWAKFAANPTYAGILTGLASTALATQITTILAQKYTPMAAGGITTKPTRALIGEAGPEAIIPLSDFSMKRAGFIPAEKTSGDQMINFYIENVYGIDDLAEVFYERIERNQQMGRTAPWTHTA